MSQYEGRHVDLKNRFNKHLGKLTGKNKDFYSNLQQSDLVQLKTVLADINNVLTFQMTIAAAKWLCKILKFDKKTKNKIIAVVDNSKPNTNGFDINIKEPIKLIAEVKCINPFNNGGKFGGAQWNSILDDAIKLKKGKGKITNTSGYLKFLFLIDLGERTDQAISELLKPSKATSNNQIRISRHKIKEHIVLLSNKINTRQLKLDKIYLKKLKTN